MSLINIFYPSFLYKDISNSCVVPNFLSKQSTILSKLTGFLIKPNLK